MLQRVFTAIYDWLAPADVLAAGDVIFALAGRQNRKSFALELYSVGVAPTLLLSVGRYEIRRFAQLPWPTQIDLISVAAGVRPLQRHFFVVLQAGGTTIARVSTGRLGTLAEMRALTAWLRKNSGVRSLLLVSSGFHLRRVRMCARALLPSSVRIRCLAVPADGQEDWWRRRHTLAVVLLEVPKLVAYRAVLLCRYLHFQRSEETFSDCQ